MGKRILLIDDDIASSPEKTGPGSGVVMWYYAQSLRDLGYEVVETNSADRAFEILTTQRFDLFLVDLMMPPGKLFAVAETDAGLRTGVVVAERLAETHPDTPVVILTMVANPSSIKLLRNNRNVKGILHKNEYLPSAVAEEIKEILGV